MLRGPWKRGIEVDILKRKRGWLEGWDPRHRRVVRPAGAAEIDMYTKAWSKCLGRSAFFGLTLGVRADEVSAVGLLHVICTDTCNSRARDVQNKVGNGRWVLCL